MEHTICIFGASTTWGAWDKEKGGWVNRLRLFLENNYEVFVYNLGVSGDTTKDLLERFETEAKARNPTIIMFSISDNDSLYIKSEDKNLVNIKDFEKNLKELIKKSKKFTNKIIFLGSKSVDESKTNPIPWQKDYYYTKENMKLYDKKVREIAENNDCNYIFLFNELNNKDFEDGLHPNSKGHEKIFQKVKEFLLNEKLLN